MLSRDLKKHLSVLRKCQLYRGVCLRRCSDSHSKIKFKAEISIKQADHYWTVGRFKHGKSVLCSSSSASTIVSAAATNKKVRPFTEQEVWWVDEVLKLYGVGNCHLILQKYPFRGRKTVNPKDKWRNKIKTEKEEECTSWNKVFWISVINFAGRYFY